ncbi:MAG: CHAT domain-containing protein [Acidobacteriota bacterium]
MATMILQVCEKSGLDNALCINEELKRAFEPEQISVPMFFSEDDARRALPGDFALVITPLQIRRSPGSPLLDDERGVDLLAWMSARSINVPGILLTPTQSEKLRRAEPRLYRCTQVPTGGTMFQDVAKAALETIRDTPAKYLDVEIQLRGRAQWNYKIVGKGFPYSYEGVLLIDEKTLADLSLHSRVLGDVVETWKEMLGLVGGMLSDALWRKREDLEYIWEGLAASEGEENTRLRFVVTPEFHDLVLEALPCPRSKSEYWMLKAPVYRRLFAEQPNTGGCLFQGGEPINCLIIEADVSGWVDDLHVRLREATSLQEECKWLFGWFDSHREVLNHGRLEWVKAEAGKPPLAERVQELLESRDWGIIHYAGHSYYDPAKKAGYVFFPDAKKAIEKIDITKFSGWLRKSTFVYLSSCDSGSGPFMFELANRRVPNLVGFRWPIDDQLAFEYSRAFYTSLLDKKSLERSFLKARQTLHASYPGDRIWATPLLIMQLIDS